MFGAALQVGQIAPDFTLTSQDGSSVSLRDLRGKWVVLYFYPMEGASGSVLEAQNFQRDIAKYQEANAVIVGVTAHPARVILAYLPAQSLTFKLLADTDNRVSQEYNSFYKILRTSSRNTFLIAPDGKIAKVWLGVSPAKHSEEVLSALSSLKK